MLKILKVDQILALQPAASQPTTMGHQVQNTKSFSHAEINRRQILVAGAATVAGSSLPFLAAASSTAGNPSSTSIEGGPDMSFVTTKDGTQIFYKDWGPKSATPIVFSHGWPLSSDDWDAQMLFFLAKGYRVIAHDHYING